MKVIGSLIHDCESGLNKPEVGNGQLIVGNNILTIKVKETGEELYLLQSEKKWWSVTDYHIIDQKEYTMRLTMNTLDDVYEKYKG